MITDSQTNVVYFSSLIKSLFPSLWNTIESLLKERKIDYHLIENTRNIWCRDYMPIQIDEKHSVQFQYFPDYFLTPAHLKYLTIQDEMQYDLNLRIKKVPLIVDGGNIVRSGTKVIMTDKVLSDNKKNHSEKVTLRILRKELKVEDIFIIPRQPNDWSGHADGMVRFYNEDTLIVNDFSQESPSWKKRMNAALRQTGLTIIDFPYVPSERQSEDGEYSAHGCYINFAQIGNTIFLPQFGEEFSNYDGLALNKAKELFKGPISEVLPVNADSIAWGGGVLNCCTWNICQPADENAIDRILPVYRMSDEILVILQEDFQSASPDTVCVQIHLGERTYHEPWSLAKHLKHGEEFQNITSEQEIAQLRHRISEMFSVVEITEIYEKLKKPSGEGIRSLTSIPERLKNSISDAKR
jgi:agmatine deiminase